MGPAPQTAMTTSAKSAARSDASLVRACLRSDEDAWSALIDRYKRLIFSIPIKYGFSRDDAGEIFQSVCIELWKGLPGLRETGALPKWLIQVTAHACARYRREQVNANTGDEENLRPAEASRRTDGPLQEAEREQNLRTALAQLSPRCRELVHMLFFECPAVPYAEAARKLGLAAGSIGFIRGRCLEKLRRSLVEAGYR